MSSICSLERNIQVTDSLGDVSGFTVTWFLETGEIISIIFIKLWNLNNWSSWMCNIESWTWTHLFIKRKDRAEMQYAVNYKKRQTEHLKKNIYHRALAD